MVCSWRLRYTRMGTDLTYEILFWHLEGRQTLGTYVINELNQCSFAVFDSDAPTGLFDLAAVQMSLTTNGIPSYLETSRRGAHLWVFFSEPISSVLVRAWLLPFCPAGVEFYPKQEAAGSPLPSIAVPKHRSWDKCAVPRRTCGGCATSVRSLWMYIEQVQKKRVLYSVKK